ncbi:alpha/beta hydrolase [Variovorax sp. PCZ-1]|nr:alpha/beta fold hydrolase [Variovorax sp. PCZ-1]MBS7806145.1 alpha/beta hydrolase [Variovorax sp. PCZ-1]
MAKSLLRLEPGAVSLSNFRWTGANTHAARVQAANDLAEHLETLVSEDPDSRVLLVGHSHGGNIILRAAHAIPDHLRAGVVCLASPFFHVRLRSTAPIFWMLSGALIAIFATFSGFVMANLARLLEYLPLTWLGQVIDWFPSFPSSVSSIGRVTSSFGGAVAAIFMTLAIMFVVGVSRIGAKYAGQQIASSRWEALQPTSIRTLCMWLAPDEAYWGLNAARTMVEWAHHVVFVATRYGLPAVTVIAAVGTFWFGWSRGMDGAANSAEARAIAGAMPAMQLGGLAMLLVPLLLIGFAALLSVIRVIATGTYRFSDFAWLDIQTQRLPQINTSLITARPLPLNSGGFLDNVRAAIPFLSGPIFHSRLYNDPRAFEEIFDWYSS